MFTSLHFPRLQTALWVPACIFDLKRVLLVRLDGWLGTQDRAHEVSSRDSSRIPGLWRCWKAWSAKINSSGVPRTTTRLRCLARHCWGWKSKRCGKSWRCLVSHESVCRWILQINMSHEFNEFRVLQNCRFFEQEIFAFRGSYSVAVLVLELAELSLRGLNASLLQEVSCNLSRVNLQSLLFAVCIYTYIIINK